MTQASAGPLVDPPPVRSELAPRRGLVTAIAIVGLACLVFGGLTAWTGARPGLTTTSIAAPAPTAVGATPGSTPATTSPASTADVDAGCEAAPARCSTIRPGGVVEDHGRRFALGDPSDQVAIAGAGCPTPPALALLRADGTTFAYDRWAEPGRDVVARPGPTVPAGSSWVPRPLDDQGCAELVVRHPDGQVVTITIAPPPPPPTAEPPLPAADPLAADTPAADTTAPTDATAEPGPVER